MDKFKEAIIKLLQKATGQKEIVLETPPQPTMGDFAFPCFPLAKAFKKNPIEIAKELAGKIKPEGFIAEIKSEGPYLNFFVSRELFVKEVLNKIQKDPSFGSGNLGKGKKALVEHTSINPNASPHVGRARNAFIGDSIVRLLRFQGYKVETRYWVNDIGKQIAMLVWGSRDKKKISFHDVLDLYIRTNKKIEDDPKLEQEIFGILQKLEANNKKVREQFRNIVGICVDGQTSILAELGIKFDRFDYESDYLFGKKTEQVMTMLKKTGKVFEDEQQRLVLDQKEFNLPMKSPVLVLTRSDKTSLYPLRDLAYTMDKHADGENIVVLGEDHKLYFQQIEAALKLLKKPVPTPIHYSFILLQEGKMSTRKGNVVLLEDFIKEALEKARNEIKKRHGKVPEETAKAIAYGAIKFSIIRVSQEKNVIFDWDQSLSFEGDSGPYIQYAYARICSIFEKFGKERGKKIAQEISYSALSEGEDFNLIKTLANFPAVVEEAATQYKPHIIATFLLDLARVTNEFYHACPVLQEKESVRDARLALLECTKKVLKTGLNLLGIQEIEKM